MASPMTPLILIVLIALLPAQVFPKLTSETGTRFVYQDDVYASYSTWVLSFSIDLKPYVKQVDTLKRCVVRFQNSIKAIEPPDAGATASMKYIHHNIMKMLNQESHDLLQQHKKLEVLYQNLTSLVLSGGPTRSKPDRKTRRPKRAILNLGGLLSDLFGTASDDDVQRLEQGMRLMKDSQKKVISVLDHSLSVLNMTNQAVHQNRRTINDLINRTEVLSGRIYTNLKMIRNLNPEILFTNMVAEFNMMFHSLSRASDALYNDVFDFYMLVTGALKGSISLKLVPPHMLSTLLMHIRRQLPSGVRLPFPFRARRGLLSYYQLLTTTLIPGTDIFHLVAVVPLIHPASKYQIYRTVSVPVFEPKTQATKEILLSSPFLAMSPDRSEYIMLTENDVTRCQSHHVKFCQFRQPVFQTATAPSCQVALFMGQPENSAKSCRYKWSNVDVPIIKPLMKGKWLLSSKAIMEGNIVCMDGKRSVEHKLQLNAGVTVVDLQAQCMLHTSSFTIPYFVRKDTVAKLHDPVWTFQNWSNHFPTIPTLLDPPDSQTTRKPVPPLSTMSDFLTPSFNWDKETLNKANDELNLEDVSSTNFVPYIISIAVLILVIFVGLVIFIVQIKYRNGTLRSYSIPRDPEAPDTRAASAIPLTVTPTAQTATPLPLTVTPTVAPLMPTGSANPAARGRKRPRLSVSDDDNSSLESHL